MATTLPLPYAHGWETMYKGIDDQGPYYKVSYYFTDWTQSDTIANQLRGYTVRSGVTTLRYPPHQHPLSPNLLCMDVEIEGIGPPSLNVNGLPSYLGGFWAHCTYRAMPWMPYNTNDPGNENQIDPTTPLVWCTQELDYDEETIPFNVDNQYTWASNSKPTGVPLKVSIGITTMVITFHQLPYLPMTVVRNLRNRINTNTFLGAPAETIWFRGARTVRDYATDGTVSQKVQLRFQERDVSWNKVLGKNGAWDYIKDANSNYMLNTADLTPLITL